MAPSSVPQILAPINGAELGAVNFAAKPFLKKIGLLNNLSKTAPKMLHELS